MSDSQSHELSEELIHRFVDGEVTEDQDRAIRLHLRESAESRRRVLEAEGLRGLIRSAAPAAPAVPAGFAAQVAREAFASESHLRHELGTVLPFVRRLTFAAAAAVLLCALTWFLAQRVEDLQTQPSVGASRAFDVPELQHIAPHDAFLLEEDGEEEARSADEPSGPSER